MPDRAESLRTWLAALAGVLAFVGGCGPAAVAPGPAAPTLPAATPVGVVHPRRVALQRVVEQPGTVRAYEETLLFARVPGYVRRLRPEVDIGYKVRGPKYDAAGKEVEPGEVLAELAVPELEEKAKQRQALVLQAEAEVDQAGKALAAAEAAVLVAEATVIEAQSNFDRWESESRRMAKLATGGVVDSQGHEETVYQFRAAGGKLAWARAAVQKAKADGDKARSDVRVARSRKDVAAADAREAEAMLGYAGIRAPFDGIVTVRKVNTGTFVQPAGGQGDWLFRVARLDPVRVVVTVPEADAELVKKGAKVKLTIQSLPDASISGVVARTSWALEPGARTLQTEIDLPNKAELLHPGMYVYARIVNPLPEAWVLPTSALARQADATVCFVIEGDKAIRTPVQLGRSDGQQVAVLRRQVPGSSAAWQEFTGAESIALRAAGLADGQAVSVDAQGK